MYINTGVWGSPVWDEVDLVIDADVDNPTNMVEGKKRGIGSKVYSPGLNDPSISFKLDNDPTDASFILFAAAKAAKSTIEIAIMDGDITTSNVEGFRGVFHVENWKRDEAQESQTVWDCSLKPAKDDGGNTFQAYTVP